MTCQHFDFNSANWFPDNLHMSSAWYLRTTGKEFNSSFQQTFVGQEPVTNPLRTSAWEAIPHGNDRMLQQVQFAAASLVLGHYVKNFQDVLKIG